MELANVLRQEQNQFLEQRSLLKGSSEDPLFGGDGGLEVYYDFHGNSSIPPFKNKVLSRVHVEWFFYHPEEYSKSTIIDTKYKQPASENNLTTIGYMTTFHVSRAVTIFRHPVDPSTFSTPEGDSRFVISYFDSGREKLYCAMCLEPSPSFHHKNSEAIQMLIRKVLMP